MTDLSNTTLTEPVPALPALREGSTLYYALLRVPAKKRAAVLALLQLSQTLATTLHDVSEVSIAEKKIHWWHEEIERLQKGNPRHPATQAVLPLMHQYALPAAAWLSVLSANNDEKFINAADTDSLHTRLLQDYQTRIQMCLRVLSENPDPDAEPKVSWALGLGLFERLRQFHRLHQYGYPVFPDDDYVQAGVEPVELGQPEKRAEVVKLFSQQILAALAQLNQALQQPDASMGAGCLPFYIVGSIRVAQLALWQKQSLLPLEAYSTLTPIKKAWLAWRCSARYRFPSN